MARCSGRLQPDPRRLIQRARRARDRRSRRSQQKLHAWSPSHRPRWHDTECSLLGIFSWRSVRPTAVTSAGQPMEKPMPDPPMTKSDFVRSLPLDMPPTEVLEKAKAAGMTISRRWVGLVRGGIGSNGSASNASAAEPTNVETAQKPAAKKTARKLSAKKNVKQVARKLSAKKTVRKSIAKKASHKPATAPTRIREDQPDEDGHVDQRRGLRTRKRRRPSACSRCRDRPGKGNRDPQ